MSNFLNNSGGYNDEDRYIRQKEAERRAELHAKREEDRKKQLGQSHWMVCPKCGSEMKEIELEGVMIDKCTVCEGVFLDKGEMELLTARKESHSFIRALKGICGV